MAWRYIFLSTPRKLTNRNWQRVVATSQDQLESHFAVSISSSAARSTVCQCACDSGGRWLYSCLDRRKVEMCYIWHLECYLSNVTERIVFSYNEVNVLVRDGKVSWNTGATRSLTLPELTVATCPSSKTTFIFFSLSQCQCQVPTCDEHLYIMELVWHVIQGVKEDIEEAANTQNIDLDSSGSRVFE